MKHSVHLARLILCLTFTLGLLPGFSAGGARAAAAENAASAMLAAEDSALQEQYTAAQALWENGEYAKAYEAFHALGAYADSRARAAESKSQWKAATYKEAIALYKAKKYDEAKALFEALGKYQRSDYYEYQCALKLLARDYQKAKELFETGEYRQAKALFDSLGTYSDCPKRAKAADEMLRAQEQAALEEQAYETAMALKAQGDLAGARDAFIEAGDCRDATRQIYIVLGLMGKEQAAPTMPMFTAKQLRDDKTSPKSEVFTAPDGTKHRYQLYKGVPTWVEAKAFCEVLGGHLATLTTEEENTFVHDFMMDCGYLTAYFGLSDEKRVGDWVWVTGEPFEYSNWDSGEPSRCAKERYGMYFYKHLKGTWNDSHFYEDAEVDPGCSFICEWDE